MASADVAFMGSPAGGGSSMMGLSDVDTVRLAQSYSVADSTFESLLVLANPLIEEVLRAMAQKSRESDELKAAKLRLDVELEQAVRTADTRVKAMRKQLDEALGETQELRGRVSAADTARMKAENELANYKSSRAGVDEEIRLFRARISTLESDKRDTLEALDRKCNDYDQLQTDYATAQGKVIDARREISTLDSRVQRAESESSTAKFRISTLEQEMKLLKNGNEWLDSELKTKIAEHQKFRKEKAAQVSTLQSELEDALSNVDIMKRSLDGVKARLTEVTTKSEERLAKISEMQNAQARQEENFRTEINAQQRLAELHEQSTKTARRRVLEFERLLEQEREEKSIELGHMKAELEREASERRKAEVQVTELELRIDRLEQDLQAYANGEIVPEQLVSRHGSPNGNGVAPQTPRRPISAMGDTPGGVFSPSAARLQKRMPNLSITQLYSDYNQAKAAAEAEQRRNAKLEEAINELMLDLEQQAPALQEIREENARLQQELVESSQVLENVRSDRDDKLKELRRLQGNVADYERESNLLKQQLRDLSLQVQVLMVEIEQRDAGAESLSAGENRIFEQIVRGELDVGDVTDTDQLITRRLVIFRNASELQEQNQNLIKAMRELGRKMEQAETAQKESMEANQNEEIERLMAVTAELQDDLRSQITKSQSFARERDMFRRMLQNKGEDTHIQPGAPASDAGSAGVAEIRAEMSEVVRELQAQYDQFKTESLQNNQTLEAQNRRLAQEKTEAEIQSAKYNSQLEMFQERYQTLKANYDLLKKENQELQTRVTSLHESQAKQDLKTQQVSEELVDSKSLLESMRTENANLKAEKNLFETMKQRLVEDNEQLTQDRSRLNTNIAELQSLQNERDRNESEARRRLTSQVDRLESELQATKRRLNEEIESAKKLSIRKDRETQEARCRIDDVNASLAKAREDLVAAQTSRDHLQSRVDELTINLKTAEEKLAVYQHNHATKEDEDDEDTAEQLAVEIAELKQTIELNSTTIANLRVEAEQYKKIAETAEEELASFTATHDQFREAMDEQIRELEAKAEDRERRLEEISSELATANQELSGTRQAEAEKLRQFEDQKSQFEVQIRSLNDDKQKAEVAAQYYQEDLRQQASIAQDAQQNYERELVKHAEAAKETQELRSKYAELRSEVHGLRTEAEAAKSTLAQNESSWEAQKDTYESELKRVKAVVDDKSRQISNLLNQLENLGEQIKSLRAAREQSDIAIETAVFEGQTTGKSEDQLREVIAHLRQEKEIVDTQLTSALNRNAMLKQQLDYTKKSLDEAKERLNNEQQRQADQLRSVTEHKELVQKITELNVLRESNATLRAESEKKTRQNAELAARNEELEAKIQPLELKVRELEAERAVLQDEMKLVVEDKERWQQRTNQILQKYDRVDPQVLEDLKKNNEEAQKRLAEADTKINELNSKIGELNNLIAEAEASKEKAVAETTEKWRGRCDKMRNQFQDKLKSLIGERDAHKQDAERLKEQLGSASGEDKQRVGDLEQENARLNEEIKGLHVADGELKQQLAKADADGVASKEQLAAATVQLEALKAETAAKQVQDATFDPQLVEQEVQRRLTEIQSSGPQTLAGADNSADIDVEVERRVTVIRAEIEAKVDAEVAQRVAEADHTAAVEAEVARRLVEVQSASAVLNGKKEEEIQSSDPQSEAERIVAERLISIRDEHARELKAKEQECEKRVGDMEENVKKRIADAKNKFGEYKKGAVAAAVNDVKAAHEKEMQGVNEKHAKEQAELQNKIARLEIEIRELKLKITELEIKNADFEKETQQLKDAKPPEIKTQEELEEKLQQAQLEHEKELAETRQNLAAEIHAEAAKRAAAPGAQSSDQERMKSIINLNLNHRLIRERSRWLQQNGMAHVAELVTAKVEEELKKTRPDAGTQEKAMNPKVEESLRITLAEKEKEIAVLKEKQDTAVQAARDQAKNEVELRNRVKFNTLEQKNKMLERQLAEAKGTPMPAIATPATPAPASAFVAQTQTPTPLVPQPTPAQNRRVSAASNAGQQSQISSLPVQQANVIASAEQQAKRAEAGTGPAAMRSLQRMGMAASNLPRAPGNQLPKSSIPQPGGAPMPAQNPFAQQTQQQQQQGQSRLPQGRGRGRGRGQAQIHTQIQQPSGVQPAQGSPTSAASQLNPGARQFVPGGKRQRDGEDGTVGGAEMKKRKSGGGGGQQGATS